MNYRVQIFIDFWNFVLSLKGENGGVGFPSDWEKIPHVFIREAMNVISPGNPGIYQGMNVYGSYDPASPSDVKLHKWARNTLDTFAGTNVYFVQRQKKKRGPKCPSCHTVVERCPVCGNNMRGTEEKGVDTLIATDMIRLAWEDNYDVAILVSADRDFIPVANFLQIKALKVIHGAFPPLGAELTQKCWGSFQIPSVCGEFKIT
ncbi:NYN domain-containing protein [Desulfolutivibrio sp.]|uniref:NYN domain-containing protein n=1 Tax=Desulfolutivibrio sp. TaxID=2773296 RepID=UPI002F96AEE2